MGIIRVKVTNAAQRAFVEKLRARLAPAEMERPVKKTTAWTLGSLVRNTPKGFTGQTRKMWSSKPVGPAAVRIFNPSKVMLFLELGTKAHGPVTSASVRPWANDPGNIRHGHERVLAGKRFRAKRLFIPLTARAAIGGWHPGLKYGVDYILALRVRGIRAMHIVDRQRAATEIFLKNAIRDHVMGK